MWYFSIKNEVRWFPGLSFLAARTDNEISAVGIIQEQDINYVIQIQTSVDFIFNPLKINKFNKVRFVWR